MSPRDEHRYVIVGAGAIGGTVGAVLARAGIPTVLVARGAHADVLAAEGLTLRTPDGTFPTPVTAAAQAEQVRLTEDDVLVFATKTQQLDAALQEWVDQPVHSADGVVGTAGERLPAMTALNGVAAEEKALRYFRRVFGVCVWLPAVHLQPGEVIVRSWPVAGQFHIATVARVDQHAGHIVAAARREGEDVLRCAGIEFTSFETSTAARADGPTIRVVPGWDARASNSTWQSLSRNTGNVETDFLNGEIVRLAHRHGTSAPLNAALARVARAEVRNGLGPGRYSASELTDLLGAHAITPARD